MEIIGVRTDEFTEAEISEIPNDRRAAAISVQSCIKGDVASVVDVAQILNGTEVAQILNGTENGPPASA